MTLSFCLNHLICNINANVKRIKTLLASIDKNVSAVFLMCTEHQNARNREFECCLRVLDNFFPALHLFLIIRTIC